MKNLPFVLPFFLATVFSPFLLSANSPSGGNSAASHEAAAETFLELNGWWDKMDQQSQLQQELAQQVSRMAGLEGEQQELLAREIAAGLKEVWEKVDWPRVEAAMLTSVQETYSPEELEVLNAFFVTSTGQKYLAENNRLEEQTIGLLNQELAAHQPLLEKRILQVLDAPHDHQDSPDHGDECCPPER
ncbi:MAG: DUF2059 domain-containing protein [Opitutales bacterium]|nr:DUF2059 domain-containing protein [Opitutales bacterium]